MPNPLKKLNIGALFSLATEIPKIVNAVQRAFGKEPGAVRKEAAMDAVASSLALVHGLGIEDITRDPGIMALADEAIEIGVQQKKLVERSFQIEQQIRALLARPQTGSGEANTEPQV